MTDEEIDEKFESIQIISEEGFIPNLVAKTHEGKEYRIPISKERYENTTDKKEVVKWALDELKKELNE